MFYKMIEKKRNAWLASTDCPVSDVIDYIEQKGRMRDAQVEAIKTWLFLKIGCGCKPLAELFAGGVFNSMDIGALELSDHVKDFLRKNKAAAALYEYADMRSDPDGPPVSAQLVKTIKEAPDRIDYSDCFRRLFYEVSYADYLFSLPMGAGKTFLMAAFIYLDLYFAMGQPQNPAFAHNFIICAPSGLKSSVVPSLRTIERFDPSWVLPESIATEIKNRIAFEVLDENTAAKRSNKTRNPNLQKINTHLQREGSSLLGLVAVTNAEKVILDSVEETDGQICLFDGTDDKRLANELRELIGKIPALSVFIDEVHHAASSADKAQERKLRAVVNSWAEKGAVNSVAGFSGTPYLEKPDKVPVSDALTISSGEITNIVYHYPLVDGIGNFLKRPRVMISDIADSSRIIELGVREFLDTYRDTTYPGGLTAKLGIYCGTIEKLEETVYPLVLRIAAEYGLPDSAILRFYRASTSKDKTKKKYTAPNDSQMQFDMLDTPMSGIRIVLLVQIGKEGWDCRSLTGIILSQEGDCPQNMVLQTACRCLRQVEKGRPESALIYLNKANADKLENQLRQQQHASIRELLQGGGRPELKCYDRTGHLNLPEIEFYQMQLTEAVETSETADPRAAIPQAPEIGAQSAGSVWESDLKLEKNNVLKRSNRQLDDEERGSTRTTFCGWLAGIVRESLYTTDFADLAPYEEALRGVFDRITYETPDGGRCFRSGYSICDVNAAIRSAFSDRRSVSFRAEMVRQTAALLKPDSLPDTVQTDMPSDYIPDPEVIGKIVAADNGELRMDPKTEDLIKALEAVGSPEFLKQAMDLLRRDNPPDPNWARAYHYLPYHTDSDFEQSFLKEVLSLTEGMKRPPEVYYNGDRFKTEFRIACYEQSGPAWRYLGLYTPDFLILRRNDENEIHKVLIVETKGQIYENDFEKKKDFVEKTFVPQNNKAFGYERFAFLYLEDSQPEMDRIDRTGRAIDDFFGAD